jgi:hypothetical protein
MSMWEKESLAAEAKLASERKTKKNKEKALPHDRQADPKKKP